MDGILWILSLLLQGKYSKMVQIGPFCPENGPEWPEDPKIRWPNLGLDFKKIIPTFGPDEKYSVFWHFLTPKKRVKKKELQILVRFKH